MPKQLLIVEPDLNLAGRLVQAAVPFARVRTAGDFATARLLLAERSFDWLITNVRLGDYNGLHLVHLVTSNLSARRALVYDEHADAWLADEAQRMGAFYEPGDRIARAIPGYLCEPPGAGDRRDPFVADAAGRRALRGSHAATKLVHSPECGHAEPIQVTYRVERRPVSIPVKVSAQSILRGQAEP